MYTCMCLKVAQHKLTALLWWLSVSHHPAGQAASGMACGLAVRVPPLAQVIFILMHHHTASDDGIGSREGNLAVLDVNRGFSVRSSNNVAKVTSMPGVVAGAAMILTRRVEM